MITNAPFLSKSLVSALQKMLMFDITECDQYFQKPQLAKPCLVFKYMITVWHVADFFVCLFEKQRLNCQHVKWKVW